MHLAGSNHVQTLFRFKHDGTTMMGDCGSLVIDYDTREVYGHIVASPWRSGIAFIWKKALSVESHNHAPLMRITGACSSCRNIVSFKVAAYNTGVPWLKHPFYTLELARLQLLVVLNAYERDGVVTGNCSR
jgi:hypothetical protein